jgi:hypothetical protein
VSGIPSTGWEFARGGDPLAATLAAGAILLPRERRRSCLLVAAVPVHVGVSLTWGVVLAFVLPVRRTILAGGLAGLAIAAFDLGVIGRMYPRIRALPRGPQLADHALYGATVGLVLTLRR